MIKINSNDLLLLVGTHFLRLVDMSVTNEIQFYSKIKL